MLGPMSQRTDSPRRTGVGGMPISLLLPLVLTALIAAAVLPVVVLGFFGARDNTGRLLRDRSEFVLEAVVDRIVAHLDPVRAQVDYIARAVALGVIDPRDEATMRPFLMGALAATPQVAGIAHVMPDRTMRRYSRDDYRVFVDAWIDEPGMKQNLARAPAEPGTHWARPAWNPILRQTIVTLQAPLFGPGGFAGTLVAAITTADLSRYLASIGAEIEATPFILLGRERVLAHPNLVDRGAAMPAGGEALPRRDAIGDPVLARIWASPHPLFAVAPLHRSAGHWTWLSDDWWSRDGYVGNAYVYRTLAGYGAEPWTVGITSPISETRRERWIVMAIGIGGALLLALALATAMWVGRRLGRPVLGLAEAARRVEALDFDAVRRLGRVISRRGLAREINEAAAAFERMAAALRWFETYLPRALVRRLIAAGATAPRSEAREVTVMFTDLENYAGFSAERPALEIVRYLNDLLARVGPPVEASGGTIDKYIGDCVMAFWGAPEEQPDHAAAACRAALAICAAVERFNEERRAAGQDACRLRVGLHTGRVVVGNIGFAGRVDYTIIGAAVNTAQRVEQAGRRHIGGAATVILASAATRAAAGAGFAFEAVGGEGEEAGRVCRLLGELPPARPARPTVGASVGS
jgi:adenylate cyclase